MFFARNIAFYEELFDKGGSLESVFCHFSCALSRFMKSCLTRVVGLKAVSVVFRAHYRVLWRGVSLEGGLSLVFRAHYRVF